MARCEDFPCCGHELGCCPDYDAETGEQLNMVCVCGAKLPIDNPSSICDGCMKPPPHECSPDEYAMYYGGGDDDDDDWDGCECGDEDCGGCECD